MTETDPYAKPEGWSATPDFDDLARRRARRETPFVDDLTVGELEPLLGTPEPDNVPQVGQATSEAPVHEGHAEGTADELPAHLQLEPPPVQSTPPRVQPTGDDLTAAPPAPARVVVSVMPSTHRNEQTVVAEVYRRDSDVLVARWIRSLPNPAPLCPEEGREHELAFAIGGGELDNDNPEQSWQVSLYVCGRCPYAETDDESEPAPEIREPEPEQLEQAAEQAATNPDRAPELRSRKDRGGRAVETGEVNT